MYAARILLFGIACFGLCNYANAQQDSVRTGAVVKFGTGIRVDSARVFNKRNKGTVFSNQLGLFSIMAAKGDTLEISGKGYENLSVVVDNSMQSIYYLKSYAATELNTVIITGSSMKKDILEAQRAYRSKGVFYTGRPHYYYLFLKPMTFIYENFKGEVRQARKFKKLAKSEAEYYDVSMRFNNSVIKKNVPIKDNELDEFKSAYWPAISQVKTWTDYDMIVYIKNSFNEFRMKKKQR